jgi:hypothetical protein
MVAEFRFLFVGEILLFCGMEIFFHLPHDMLSLVMIANLKVRRRFSYLIRMPAVGTEFPELEVIHIRKGPATGAAHDEVHVIMVPSSDLYKYISSLPHIVRELMKKLKKQLFSHGSQGTIRNPDIGALSL